MNRRRRWVAVAILAAHVPFLSGCELLSGWVLYWGAMAQGQNTSATTCSQNNQVWNEERQRCEPRQPWRTSPRHHFPPAGKTAEADTLPDLPDAHLVPLPDPFDPLRLQLRVKQP